MRNTRPTAILLFAGILGAQAAGCATHVGPGPLGGNPGLDVSEYSYAEDGFQDPHRPRTFRVFLDRQGRPAPDPREHAVDDEAYAACGHDLARYFERTSHPYEPARITWGFAYRISRACDSGRPLVVLIHGINNPYPDARRSYDLARLAIRDRFPRLDPVILEVYWDGLAGDPIAAWQRAQTTSIRAGLGLRPLLNGLAPDIPLRFLTHSRGSTVAASALWNLPVSGPTEEERDIRRRQREFGLPSHANVRAAFLVPAMGGSDFRTYASGDGSPLDRLIVGVNEHDPALGKGILPADWFGDTSMGCSPEVFYESVRPVFGDRALLSDLSGTFVHGFKDALLRRRTGDQILPQLFASERPAVPIAGQGK